MATTRTTLQPPPQPSRAPSPGSDVSTKKKKGSGGQKLNNFVNKMGKPMNKFANKMGCEAFSPQEMELEIEKAARILRSFCLDGFWAAEEKKEAESSGGSASASASASTADQKKDKPGHGRERKALRKIPPGVIQNAKGLAVFTTMRFGLHIGGSNGCGVLIKRLPDGSWSPPSGIHMANMSAGLVAGLDVYDCVAVINTDKGMESFTRVRGTIGGEVTASVGPLGAGMMGDVSIKNPAPVWTYTKNRGLYLGAHLDGTIYIERTNENPKFYGVEGVRHAQILAGEVQPPAGSCTILYQTLNAIEGKEYNPADLPPPYADVVGNEQPAPQPTSYQADYGSIPAGAGEKQRQNVRG